MVAQAGDPAASPESSSADFRLLVVDDHPETLLLLQRLLRDLAVVDTATSAEEAHRKCGDIGYHMLVVDINLGEDETGTDLLKALRRRERYQQVPVIACTAYALPGDRARILKAGFDGYISKPFSKSQLLQEVNRLRGKG